MSPAAEEITRSPGYIVHEDAVRLVRQRLIALEQGRDADARTIEEFLTLEFGIHLIDTTPAQQPAERLEMWRRRLGLPDGVEKVTVILEYNREPIWRIPEYREGRPVGSLEVPIHLQPTDPLSPEPPREDFPEVVRPRAGALPPRMMKAIRLPGQVDEEEPA